MFEGKPKSEPHVWARNGVYGKRVERVEHDKRVGRDGRVERDKHVECDKRVWRVESVKRVEHDKCGKRVRGLSAVLYS